MAGRKLLSLLAALVIVAVPMGKLYAAKPAHAAVCPWWAHAVPAVCGTIWVTNNVKKIWEKAECVTDIDCLVRNATVAYLNTAGLILFGLPFTELTDKGVEAALNGEWDGGGLAFTTVGMLNNLYSDPPGLRELHLASHLKHELSDNLISGKGAYATAGETMLGPIEEIWEKIRNLTYGLFLAIMVAIGFMIMLQKQVPPRTVLTVTSALPKILIGLVLITFSFSIVALAFDVIGVFGSRLIINTVAIDETIPPGDRGGGLVGAFLGDNTSTFVGEVVYSTLSPFFANENATMAQAFQALSVYSLTGLVLCVTMIGILIQLCYRTVKLLIAAVISPLAFLIGTLPGQEEIMSKFALGIVADCAAFPAIALMFSITQRYLRASLTYVPPDIAEVPVLGDLATTGTIAVTVIITLILLVVTFIVPSKVAGVINPKRK